MQRVQKLMSNYGYCSRRAAEELIKQAKVTVNNKIITIGDKASETDIIKVEGKPINKEKRIYIMFHKPLKCVTALEDPVMPTIMDYINIKERIFPVGRLDYNTSGILLLTNDGDFSNNIIHPSKEVNKTYLVATKNKVTQANINQLRSGIMVKGKKTYPAKVKSLTPDKIEITIHEGRNRIIRNMLETLDIQIKYLKRIKIGNLSLGNLKEAKYKHLSKKEIDSIFAK